VSVKNDNIEVLATEGVSKLGGDDFDKALRDIAKRKFLDITGQQADDSLLPLSEMAKIKIKLSDREKTPFMIDGEIVEITRTEFEREISSLINQTELLCETVLDEAELEVQDIQAVLLAGGSTRVPAIKQSIEKVFKQTPNVSENVDEVVALGAALYAAMKSTGEHLSASQAASIDKLKVAEISTYYFGTLSVGFNNARQTEEIHNSIIISKGEKIPCQRTSEFQTMHENQTAIRCRVTKSGSPETDPRFVSVVWEGELELPEDRPAGQIVKVTYSFDENGMMQCEFLDVESGRETKIQLDNNQDSAGSSEIDKFLVD
jgi:molecular chaperone DnaK